MAEPPVSAPVTESGIAPEDRSRRPGIGRLRRAALGLALGLFAATVLLALLEGILTLAGAGEGALYDDPFVGFAPGSPLFAERTLRTGGGAGERVWATRPEKLQFFNEQSFPAEKAPGTYRIFTLGGSTTFGHPYDDAVSFAGWLRHYLPAADPSRRWEVVNAGGISYASYRIAELTKELVRYEPDLFVLYDGGHNEFLEERTYSELIHRGAAVKRLRMWLSGFRFAALLRQGLRGSGDGGAPAGATTLEPEVAARLESWTGVEAYERDPELRRAVIEHFAFNLDRMAAIAGDAGAELAIVVPVSNVKDFSPFKSEHGAAIDAAAAARFAALLAAGRERLAAGDPRAALGPLGEAAALDPEHAEGRFRLGRALLETGDFEGAARELLAAKELDVAPLRAIEPLIEETRRAAARHRLPLVDLQAILEEDSRRRFGHPILGDEYLLDHVHIDVERHSLVAERVIEVLAEAGELRPAPDWNEARRRALYDRKVAAIDREYNALRDLNVAKVLGWAGKLEEAEAPLLRAAEVLDTADLHLNLGILYQRTGRPEQALAELERGVALDPDRPEGRFNLGVTLGRLGRLEEGVAELRRAVELRPGYPEAWYDLGVLLREQGDLDEAVDALRRALEIDPDAAAAHAALAVAYGRLGRAGEAAAALAEADRLDPGRASAARATLALDLAREGRLDEAERELTALVETHPSAETWYNLGLVRARRGLPAEARAAYEQALALDPSHAPAHNNLGIAHAAAGDLAAARRHLEQATAADPGYAEAWLNLGVVLDQSGDPAGALAALERAAALEPDNPRIQQALDLLRAHAASR